MQWRGRRQSSNVDDRRGISGGGIAAGGGVIGLVIYLLYTFLGGGGGDVSQIPQMLPGSQKEMTAEEQKADDERARDIDDQRAPRKRLAECIGHNAREEIAPDGA